ncbi:hypothetical protein QN277_017856 [Acacia crassicarpa]|uniref:Reverse transcriptase domain-containing protein n=1 Tax=Acacia crassicarpa TaxID=499986 RepID=A0AAE1JPW6_9FABA|nr:hypothetical protein QN277_017856 [Acacia crassicarpa]
MNLLAWNCQGLGVALTVRNLRDECSRKKPHLVFLMETKQKAKVVRKVRRKCGFNEEWIVNPVGKSGGLALWWSEGLIVNILFSSSNIIHTSVWSECFATPSYITFIYAPTDEGERMMCWQEIRRFSNNIGDAWMCIGDFNDILSQHEKSGGRPHPWRRILNFKCLLADCELEDLGYNGPTFTWCNNRDFPDTIHERIDRALGNLLLRELFPCLQVFNVVPAGSDHHLLFVNFHNEKRHYNRVFRFESAWALHESFREVIKGCWQDYRDQDISTLDIFVSNLKRCTQTLLAWSKKVFPNSGKSIELLKGSLADLALEVRSSEVSRKIMEVKGELDRVLEREEQYWWQRSRNNWLGAGDRNTRFFHISTIKRRQQNRISCIRNDEGNWLYEKEDISDNIATFFQELFTTSGNNSMDTVLGFIEPSISSEMNSSLLAPVSADEIKAAAFSLGGSKAPGPDGFSGKFYHSCWSEIGESVCGMIKEFFAGHLVLNDLNETNITLIPKVQKPEHVSHFRPIGLCNFSYKIISKILANRMRPLLDTCISQNQNAFVPGRCIHDNIIIANEVYHYLRRKKDTGKYEFALKMDMSKAYDRVEWNFLEKVLFRFGFCPEWVSLVMKCVCSVSLNICLSGEKVSSFTPSRGIRQGDPLSPYLFIIVAEVLSIMIRRSQSDYFIKGVKLSHSCPELTHSFFADDALLYMRASQRNCIHLADILKMYCTASGQVINLDKSSIFFSSNTPDDVKDMVGRTLGIPATEDPGRYLGIPSIWGKTKHQALAYVRERIANKIQGWGHSLLSYAGREVMIKAVLQAISIYPMNVFKFPAKTCKEINSLIANFWWSGTVSGSSIHWKAWESLTKAKSAGGMGFRDLSAMNDALLAKTAWRLLTRPDDLWARVLKSVYFPKGGFMKAGKGHKASWCWSSILVGREFLKQDLHWDIGDGASISIWDDIWVPQVTFPEKPNNLDPIIAKGRVCDLIVDGKWDLSSIDQYISAEIKSAIYGMSILSNGLPDKLVWTNAQNGVYSVKAGYHISNEKVLSDGNKAGSSIVVASACWKSIWKIKVIPRVQHFIWRILNNAVATNGALYKRRRSQNRICPICTDAVETVEHLFFHCPWTRCVWFGSSLGVKLDVVSILNFNAWWIQISGMSSLDQHNLSLICWILWFIWKQRNNLVFDHKDPNPIDVIQCARKNNFDFWVNCDKKNINPEVRGADPAKPVVWSPPTAGTLKYNCDGAFSPNGTDAAIGVICRDQLGGFKWGFVAKVKSISAFMTEALALKRALMLAVDLGHDMVIFETDCLSLAKCVDAKAPDMIDWRSRSIIFDIICLLGSKVGFSLSFTPRGVIVLPTRLRLMLIKGCARLGGSFSQHLLCSLF